MGGPVVQTGPFDSAEYVLNLVRVRGNDAIQTLAGDLIADDQPYTLTMLNAAYRHLQRKLVNAGIETFTKEAQLLQTPPPYYITDPGLQVYFDFLGYNDGVLMHDNPVLPVDMIAPLRMWERQSADANAPFNTATFFPMQRVTDALPSRVPATKAGIWEWRNDRIYMIGCTQITDFRLKYNCWLADLVDSSSLVMIVNSAEALAYYTIMEFCRPRGSALADVYEGKGDIAVEDMIRISARSRQRQNIRRRPYSGANHSGWGWW